MKRVHRILCSFVVLLAIVLMVALSFLPGAAPTEHYHFDKIVHFSAFFGLTLSILFFVRHRLLALYVTVFMLITGGMIELLQQYVPKRSGTWGDFAADAAGVMLAALVVRLYHKKKGANK